MITGMAEPGSVSCKRNSERLSDAKDGLFE